MVMDPIFYDMDLLARAQSGGQGPKGKGQSSMQGRQVIFGKKSLVWGQTGETAGYGASPHLAPFRAAYVP
jgi:hypothetical protein